MLDLGINYFRCNDCGAMIYPQGLISTKAQPKYVKKIVLPPKHTAAPAESLLPKSTYDEIQAGLHDDNPNLVRFKGKPYDECIATRREEYKVWRDAEVIAKKHDADEDEKELKKNAKAVRRAETEDDITLEADRFECVIEGIEDEGRALCPRCGRELCSWKKHLGDSMP